MKVFRTALWVAALDQLTKLWVVGSLAPGETRPLWAPWVYLSHVQNPGAAFGIFSSGGAWLAFVAAALWFIAWIFRASLQRQPRSVRWAVALGLGGAAGNLVDRIARGAVVDFIDLRFWPVFNLADVAIVLATVILIAASFQIPVPRRTPRSLANPESLDGVGDGE